MRDYYKRLEKKLKKKQHDEAKANGINLVEGSARSNAMCNINEYLRDNELESLNEEVKLKK